jgi:hypothetical protein
MQTPKSPPIAQIGHRTRNNDPWSRSSAKPSRGTEGSNPSPSSGESNANLTAPAGQTRPPKASGIEAYLTVHAGISPAAVDKFDKAYEAKRKRGDDSEPGDDPRAPYHREHVFASKIERLLAKQLGVDWTNYDREVSSK